MTSAELSMTGELIRSLGALAEPPRLELAQVAGALDLGPLATAAEFTDLFVLQLVPYASVYLGPEGMLGGEARDRVAGFWRALGAVPPAEPDHLTVLLSFYAGLVEREESAVDDSEVNRYRLARAALFWEHLASWLPFYLQRVREVGVEFYGRWAALLADVLLEEARSLGPPAEHPACFREAPTLSDPRHDGADRFLDSLLAPIASGAILTRTDLASWARTTGAALRIGERRFVLKNLWSQEPEQTATELVQFFERAAVEHRSAHGAFGLVAEEWSARASSSAKLLSDLARGLASSS